MKWQKGYVHIRIASFPGLPFPALEGLGTIKADIHVPTHLEVEVVANDTQSDLVFGCEVITHVLETWITRQELFGEFVCNVSVSCGVLYA